MFSVTLAFLIGKGEAAFGSQSLKICLKFRPLIVENPTSCRVVKCHIRSQPGQLIGTSQLRVQKPRLEVTINQKEKTKMGKVEKFLEPMNDEKFL